MAASRFWLLEWKYSSLLVVSILPLVVPIRPLLRWLWGSRLCRSVTPILLTLSLWVVRILRTWATL